ncbi:MAG: DUF1573 domain-containing protein [bacterium]
MSYNVQLKQWPLFIYRLMSVDFRTALILVLATLLTQCHAATNNAALWCENPVFDFGTRINTEDLKHAFILDNRGQAPLVVSQVRSGCGCTQATMDRSTIPPGESATLSTRLTLRGVVGAKRTSIYLHTSDPLNSIYQLQLTGTALAELDLVPTALHFVVPMDPTNLTVSLVIRNNTVTPLHPLTLETNAPFCRIQLETNVPGRQYTLSASLLSTALTTAFSGMVVIRTDHPTYPRIEIPVSASLIRNLSPYPTELVLREIPAGRPQENRYIILQSSSNQAFKVLGVEAIPPTLPVSLHSQKPCWARIKVGPMRPTDSMNGTVIRICTDFPRQPTVDIPVKVVRP